MLHASNISSPHLLLVQSVHHIAVGHQLVSVPLCKIDLLTNIEAGLLTDKVLHGKLTHSPSVVIKFAKIRKSLMNYHSRQIDLIIKAFNVLYTHACSNVDDGTNFHIFAQLRLVLFGK